MNMLWWCYGRHLVQPSLPCLVLCSGRNLVQFPLPCLVYTLSVSSSYLSPFHHTNLFFHFYSPRPIPTSIVIAQQRRNKVKNARQVSACANQNQFTQTDRHTHKRSSWKETIRDHVKNGFHMDALRMYYQMQGAGIVPDKWVFLSVIKACDNLSDLQAGRKIHEDIIERGFESDVFVGTALLSMYAKCGSLEDARQLFERMPERDVVSWNAIIASYSQNDHAHEALTFFNEMQFQGIKPNSSTIVSILPVCAYLLALEQGKQIHGYGIRNGFESDILVSTGFVDMYAKCGNVNIAHKLFERMPEQDVVSWNALITGYSQNGHPHEALALINEMQVRGIKPNSITIVSSLPACADLMAVYQGKQIHSYAIRSGFESDVVVGTGLVDMYTKCGNVNIARKLFERMPKQNVVSWNAIIAGYYQNGHPQEALASFNEMQVHGIKPNSSTIVSILPACVDLLALEQGKQIHGYVIKSGFESEVVVFNGFVNMYAKCGNANSAHKLFGRMPERDLVSWTAIIAAYSQNGYPHEALAFFNEMQIHGIKPNSITMVSVLPACAHLMALEQGKQIHGYALRSGFESDVVLGTGLVNMYAKCGNVNIAHKLFERMPERDVASWNAMILGYGNHGHGDDALAVFSQMQQTGTKPNHITFTTILTACSHAGLVDQGRHYFECMKSDYGLAPKMEHFACLVDLLGRAGHLDEAHNIIKKMPLEPHPNVWGALLGACRIHCNIELAEQAAKHLFELEPNNAGYYVLLSNIYADACRWEDVVKLRTMMKERGVKKQPGISVVAAHRGSNFKHSSWGTEHIPNLKKNMQRWKLVSQMRKERYVLNTNFVLQDVDEEAKENILCSHREKLAISFGIINSSPSTPICIMKNLRVCSGCHNATKFISKIVGR